MPWLTTEEAARILGYHPESIRRLLRKGSLSGIKYGPVWFVDNNSVQEFKKHKGKLEKHDPRRGERA